LLRDRMTFRLFRYVGPGVFVLAWVLSTRLGWKPFDLAAFAGAVVMLFGTARRQVES